MQARTKLAVILHADVVGSTTLVQLDERLAHERMQCAFRAFSDVIVSYGGTTHELRGDALVAEFERASDALSASLVFQQMNSDQNAGLADEVRPEIRIGVSLGEVIIADGTMTGAGIVLAQRLEQLAEPGGLVAQGAVSEAVPSRLPFEYEDLGEQRLKGFDTPVRAVRVRASGPVPDPEQPAARVDPGSLSPPEARIPFIAVLPFGNASPNPDDAFFADGITEDIITELSRYQDIRILARASSFEFKDRSVDVETLHRDFGVDYVLNGNVRRAGNRVRITVELVSAESRTQVWTERYDREMHDVFDLQDEMTRTIVAVVPNRLGHAEVSRNHRQLPQDLNAYDCVLRAKLLHHKQNPTANQEARELLERAIELDPQYAAAYGWLGCVLGQAIGLGTGAEVSELLERDLASVCKGLELDDNDIECHRIRCEFHMLYREWDDALRHHEKAVSLNPNDPRIIAQRGELFTKLGDAEEGVRAMELAVNLDPFEADSRAHLMGRALFAAGRYEEAVRAFKRIDTLKAEHHADIAASLALDGDVDAAARHRESALALDPTYTLSVHMGKRPYKHSSDANHHADGLKRAGFTD